MDTERKSLEEMRVRIWRAAIEGQRDPAYPVRQTTVKIGQDFGFTVEDLEALGFLSPQPDKPEPWQALHPTKHIQKPPQSVGKGRTP